MKKLNMTSLTSYNARSQTRMAIALMSIIPLLVTAMMALFIYIPGTSFSIGGQIGIMLFTMMLALCGFLVIRKYPENIIRLRHYIADAAEGALPDKVELLDAKGSDDIRFIEDGFNTVLAEMRNKVALVEKQLRVEKRLRKTIELQHQNLILAEQHRTMIHSLGAACHHIGQPATVLGMHLYLMKEHAESDEARAEIDECMKDLELIGTVLEKLKCVSEYRTTSYIKDSINADGDIIDIDDQPTSPPDMPPNGTRCQNPKETI